MDRECIPPRDQIMMELKRDLRPPSKLTRLELIAAMAMQGLWSCHEQVARNQKLMGSKLPLETMIAKMSVAGAKALCAELDKEQAE